MDKKIILVNPKDITKVSPFSGCAKTRNKRMVEVDIQHINGFIGGEWDNHGRDILNLCSYEDYILFKEGKPTVFQWGPLIQSIKQHGYKQDPNTRYIEVAIGKTGEIFLTDGRHRLILAQEFGIKEIPVNVLDIHTEYDFGNLKSINNEIIPEFLYNIIANKWNKSIDVYHHYNTLEHRYNLIKEYLPLLHNKDVIEIGPNSGMMMWSIMKYAKSLIELEKQEIYFEQCKITHNSLKSLHEGLVSIFNKSLGEVDLNNIPSFNAAYISFVLYHLNNNEIEILKRNILSRCDVVIIPNRLKERRSNINDYYLNRNSEIKKLLESCKFKVDIDDSRVGYSVVTGTK